ncbi:MAG: hypothetical protein Q8P67_09160, partial [archaeon]|nr:hypothetical protein [archaeon]
KPSPGIPPTLLVIITRHLTEFVSQRLRDAAAAATDESDIALTSLYSTSLDYLMYGSFLIGDIISGDVITSIPPGAPLRRSASAFSAASSPSSRYRLREEFIRQVFL